MWVFFTLLNSFFAASYFLLNQKMELKASLFMVYRGLSVFFMLLPFIGFFAPVLHWEFYALCILQGCFIAYVDNKFFTALRRWGAEVATSLQPFTVGITFVLWLLLVPSTMLVYLSEPIKFAFILLALFGVIVSIVLFNRSSISTQALKFLLSTLLIGAICEIVNKRVMSFGAGDLISASYFYVLITGLVAGSINLFVYVKKDGTFKEVMNVSNLKYLPIFVVLIGSMVSKNFAMFYTFNPSYVSALMYIYILWIALFNTVRCKMVPGRVCYRMNVKAALMLLLSVSVLILATR